MAKNAAVFDPNVTELRLDDPSRSLAGIEACVRLQSLSLVGAFELEAACELLAELPELTELYLSTARIPAQIAKLPSLISVSANAVDAEALARLGRLPTLRRLELRGTIPDALGHVAQITSLVLSTSAIPASLGALVDLEELELSGKVKTIPDEVGKLQKLTRLELGSTRITRLPDALCACTALEEISTSWDRLGRLPEQIGRLRNLRLLDVGRGLFQKLPASIGELANLRVLNLPGKVTTAPPGFEKLTLEKFHGSKQLAALLTMLPPPVPTDERVALYDAARIPADFGDPRELVLVVPEHVGPLPQLGNLKRLDKLRLDVGDLADALGRLATAPHLTELEIETHLDAIPEQLGGLSHLTRLEIESRARDATTTTGAGTVKKLPRSINRLAQLERLVIKQHALTALPPLTGLGKLTHVELEVRGLPSLAALGGLPALAELQLDETEQLTKLELVTCVALTTLWLGDTAQLADLRVLAKLRSLRTLRIWDVRPSLLPDICAADQLEELELVRCEAKKLPAAIGALTALKVLKVGWRQLVALPPQVKALTALRRIYVPRALKDAKDQLPAGRWKKGERSGEYWFDRTD